MPGEDDARRTRARRGTGRLHAGRAIALLIAFVAATVLLLGPAGRQAGLAPPSSVATTTTTVKLPPVNRGTTSVQVANGTNVANQATRYTQVLATKGWATLPPADSTSRPTHTIVYFSPGQKHAADEVAADLNRPTSYVVALNGSVGMRVAPGTKVVVVIGPDLANAS